MGETPEQRLERELQGEPKGQRLREQDVTSGDRLDDGQLSEDESLPGDRD